MISTIPTHVAYSDESNYLKGRFRSLGLLTLGVEAARLLEEKLATALASSEVDELKWKKLASARQRFAAIKAIDLLMPYLGSTDARIDVLVWDIEDSRHKVKGRDDITNLQILYYQLFKNVLRLRWGTGLVWRLVPDENNQIDWGVMEGYLGSVNSELLGDDDLLTNGSASFSLHRLFGIDCIEECRSHETPLSQIADLFAGLGSYSRASFEKYEVWLRDQGGQIPLLPDNERLQIQLSNADCERCQVMRHLHTACRNASLGVGLTRTSGFRTFDPSRPLNFWWYTPQHPDDKAPMRGRSR